MEDDDHPPAVPHAAAFGVLARALLDRDTELLRDALEELSHAPPDDIQRTVAVAVLREDGALSQELEAVQASADDCLRDLVASLAAPPGQLSQLHTQAADPFEAELQLGAAAPADGPAPEPAEPAHGDADGGGHGQAPPPAPAAAASGAGAGGHIIIVSGARTAATSQASDHGGGRGGPLDADLARSLVPETEPSQGSWGPLMLAPLLQPHGAGAQRPPAASPGKGAAILPPLPVVVQEQQPEEPQLADEQQQQQQEEQEAEQQQPEEPERVDEEQQLEQDAQEPAAEQQQQQSEQEQEQEQEEQQEEQQETNRVPNKSADATDSIHEPTVPGDAPAAATTSAAAAAAAAAAPIVEARPDALARALTDAGSEPAAPRGSNPSRARPAAGRRGAKLRGLPTARVAIALARASRLPAVKLDALLQLQQAASQPSTAAGPEVQQQQEQGQEQQQQQQQEQAEVAAPKQKPGVGRALSVSEPCGTAQPPQPRRSARRVPRALRVAGPAGPSKRKRALQPDAEGGGASADLPQAQQHGPDEQPQPLKKAKKQCDTQQPVREAPVPTGAKQQQPQQQQQQPSNVAAAPDAVVAKPLPAATVTLRQAVALALGPGAAPNGGEQQLQVPQIVPRSFRAANARFHQVVAGQNALQCKAVTHAALSALAARLKEQLEQSAEDEEAERPPPQAPPLLPPQPQQQQQQQQQAVQPPTPPDPALPPLPQLPADGATVWLAPPGNLPDQLLQHARMWHGPPAADAGQQPAARAPAASPPASTAAAAPPPPPASAAAAAEPAPVAAASPAPSGFCVLDLLSRGDARLDDAPPPPWLRPPGGDSSQEESLEGDEAAAAAMVAGAAQRGATPEAAATATDPAAASASASPLARLRTALLDAVGAIDAMAARGGGAVLALPAPPPPPPPRHEQQEQQHQQPQHQQQQAAMGVSGPELGAAAAAAAGLSDRLRLVAGFATSLGLRVPLAALEQAANAAAPAEPSPREQPPLPRDVQPQAQVQAQPPGPARHAPVAAQQASTMGPPVQQLGQGRGAQKRGRRGDVHEVAREVARRIRPLHSSSSSSSSGDSGGPPSPPPPAEEPCDSFTFGVDQRRDAVVVAPFGQSAAVAAAHAGRAGPAAAASGAPAQPVARPKKLLGLRQGRPAVSGLRPLPARQPVAAHGGVRSGSSAAPAAAGPALPAVGTKRPLTGVLSLFDGVQ